MICYRNLKKKKASLVNQEKTRSLKNKSSKKFRFLSFTLLNFQKKRIQVKDKEEPELISVSEENDTKRKCGVRRKLALTIWPKHLSENLFLPMYQTSLKELDNYIIGELVGKGAFSQVFKVTSGETGLVYALKKLQKSSIITNQLCNQVQDEVEILESLDHPFIIKLISRWQSKGYLYQGKTNIHNIDYNQVLPYVSDGDLFTIWKRLRIFTQECIAHAVVEITTALDYMHERKVIYRDLKMENILLNSNGHILLSDFGLSKKLETSSKTYTICGTLKYIAPEVASGNGYSFECDWWSLGVIVFTMATGKFPFDVVSTHTEMLTQIKQKIIHVPRLSNDDGIKEVVRKLMQYRPYQRTSSTKELLQLKLFKDIELGCINNQFGPFFEYLH